MTYIEVSDYHDAIENHIGWCTSCKGFTRSGIEPYEEGYDCPVCETDSVIGPLLLPMLDNVIITWTRRS